MTPEQGPANAGLEKKVDTNRASDSMDTTKDRSSTKRRVTSLCLNKPPY